MMNLKAIYEQMTNPKNKNIMTQAQALIFGKNEEQQKQIFYDLCSKNNLDPTKILEQAKNEGYI